MQNKMGSWQGLRSGSLPSWKTALGCGLVLSLTMASQADTPACNPKTPLETVYCQVQSRGEAGDLPPLYEFRKNPAATQALLLKRPAQKLGIEIPAPAPKKPPSTPASAETNKPAKASVTPQKPSSLAAAEPVQPRGVVAKPVGTDLTGCGLNKEVITCGQAVFHLEFNRPNQQLAAGALTKANRLQFPPGPQNSSQVGDYLLTSYRIYIDKMVALGLAAATLTYGKFCGIYAEVSRQNVDFGARFTRMYEFLQQDKTRQQPPKRFTQALPQGLHQCWRLSAGVVICDDQGINWIYRTAVEPAKALVQNAIGEQPLLSVRSI